MGQCRGAAGGSLNWLPCTRLQLLALFMTFVSTAAWLRLLLPRSLQVPALAIESMTGAICSSGARIRDRSTTEEQGEEKYSPIIEPPSVVSSLIRRFRSQSVQAVVSSKSTDNQSMGEARRS
jgi:hypothetical protein